MNEISTKILQKLYSLSVQPEVNFTISIKSMSENIGCNYETADNTLVELENERYIDTFRSSHDVARLFGIRLTKKGFDYSVEQGWQN